MLLGVVFLATQIGSNEPQRMYAVNEKEAVLMLPPETVCGSEAGEFEWTGDGSALVTTRSVVDLGPAEIAAMIAAGNKPDPALQAKLNPRTELIVWSARSRKARVVTTLPAGAGSLSYLRPLAASDRMIVDTSERVAGANGVPDRMIETITMLNAGAGTLTRLAVREMTEDDVAVFLSPTRALGALEAFTQDGKSSQIQFFGPNGKIGSALTIPGRVYVSYDDKGLPETREVVKLEGKRTLQKRSIDVATGRLGTPVRWIPKEEVELEPPMVASQVRPRVEAGATAPTILLSLKGSKAGEQGVLTTDGVKPSFSPKYDAVAYVSQGSLMVRSLARVSRDAYDQARTAAARTEALNKAKQVGLGFIMYASDMDDVLPGQGADVRTLIGPYLRNDSLFDGFTYTFGGGKMEDVEKPAETEMGFVPGPGGRAVVYVDGHAKWIPDK